MALKQEIDIPSFDVRPEYGLSLAQVEERKKQKLDNRIKKEVSKPYWRIFFDNFANPFNVLLIIITVMMIWGRLRFTNFLFAFILALNIGIGIYQDIHARHLIEKLKVLSSDECVVLREGKEAKITKEKIVLSDIIILSQGDQIPADAVVRTGHCACDESLLTGESVAAKKVPGDELYSGSFIKSGKVVAEVTHVGKDSYAEKLQSSAKKFARPKSEIAQSVWDITAICTLIALGFGIAYIIVAFIRKDITWDTFFPEMTAQGSNFIEGLSGSMVAMLPTGMFLLTSVALTTGVIHLAKKNMLVQELYCIEMLARVDVVCFDKTGTLTDGNMSVGEVIPLNGFSEKDIGLGVSLILNATGDDNVTARALKEKFGDQSEAAVSNVPFDSENKYSAATRSSGGTFCLGAYGFVPAKKETEIELLLDSYKKKGYRCIVLAFSKNDIDNGVLPKDFKICAVLVLHDHIKEDAKDNIAWFQESGVQICVISGDDPVTVSEIAAKCGVEGARDYIDMSTVSDEEIPELVKTKRVFGRVLPEQKKQLVLAMQAQGHKVAMTGDGVNDILALKAADCSIAMASGASAAKNAAHLICTKSDFSSLPDVVAQGRRVINNLQRSCTLFLSKTVFALVVSTAFLIALACGGGRYPFSTSHLLVWEVITIGLASFFLALQPSAERISGSMLKNIFLTAVPCGIAEALCVAFPFLFGAIVGNNVSYAPEFIRPDIVTMATLAFTLFSFLTLFEICRPFNKYRLVVFGGSIALASVILLLDFFLRDPEGKGIILHILWKGFSWGFPVFLITTLVAVAVIYFIAMYFLVTRPKKRRQEQ